MPKAEANMAESSTKSAGRSVHVIVRDGDGWSQKVTIPGMGSVRVVRGDVIDRASRAANSEIRATIDKRGGASNASKRG